MRHCNDDFLSMIDAAQRQNETHRAIVDAVLARVEHDAWILKRGRFKRIFLGEVAAEQQ